MLTMSNTHRMCPVQHTSGKSSCEADFERGGQAAVLLCGGVIFLSWCTCLHTPTTSPTFKSWLDTFFSPGYLFVLSSHCTLPMVAGMSSTTM